MESGFEANAFTLSDVAQISMSINGRESTPEQIGGDRRSGLIMRKEYPANERLESAYSRSKTAAPIPA